MRKSFNPNAVGGPVFAGGAVRRAAERRAHAAALARDPGARALMLWRGKPLLQRGARLGWVSMEEPALGAAVEPPVFLGLTDDGPRFAQDVSHLPGPRTTDGFLDPTTLTLRDDLVFTELRAAMAALPRDEAGDAATARGILEWRRTHPRCARCGGATAQEEGGWRRGCLACGAKHFPRTDPVVIMLVLHEDRALLGRQPSWPEGMMSLLAGFMEPGESVEEAVRRETFEEAGVPVGDVRYLLSQPWPFPASLMIGCVGEALDDAITVDELELESAFWASRDEVAASFKGEASFSAAREGSAAREILRRWVAGAV